MKRYFVAAALASVFFSALSARTAAPQTPYPGQMTDARVWVQNRGASDAVSIDLRSVSLDHPLRVHVTNGEPGDGEPLAVRPRVAQSWEYDTVALGAGANAAAALNARGAAGWEAVGVVGTGSDAMILIKRLR
jgi:hypothetical protein